MLWTARQHQLDGEGSRDPSEKKNAVNAAVFNQLIMQLRLCKASARWAVTQSSGAEAGNTCKEAKKAFLKTHFFTSKQSKATWKIQAKDAHTLTVSDIISYPPYLTSDQNIAYIFTSR